MVQVNIYGFHRPERDSDSDKKDCIPLWNDSKLGDGERLSLFFSFDEKENHIK